jgi:hypothetical protein
MNSVCYRLEAFRKQQLEERQRNVRVLPTSINIHFCFAADRRLPPAPMGGPLFSGSPSLLVYDLGGLRRLSDFAYGLLE